MLLALVDTHAGPCGAHSRVTCDHINRGLRMPARRSGRKTRGRLPVDSPEQEIRGPDDSTAETEEGERPTRLDELLASIAPEAERFSVHVFRKPATGENAGRAVYLAPKLALSEFSLDAVRERHGGGNYEFRVMRMDERGVWRFYRTISQAIAGAPRLDVEPLGLGGLPPGGPVRDVPAPAGDRLDRLERIVGRLVKHLQTPAAPVAPAASPLDMLKTVGEIVQSFRGDQNADPMQWLKLGVSLASKNSENGSSDGLSRFLGDMAPVVKRALEGNPNPTAAPAAPPLAPVMTVPNGHEPAAAKLVPVWLQLAAPFLPVVHGWARAGDQPDQRAQYVIGLLPEAHVHQIAEAAEAPDFVGATLGVLPPPFREPGVIPWMTTFLETLQGELTESDETEDATTTAQVSNA